MTLVQLAAHLVNLLFFVYAALNYGRVVRAVFKSRLSSEQKEIFGKEALVGISVAGVFVVLQTDWIVASHNEVVGASTSWLWLLFDYALAVYLSYNGDKSLYVIRSSSQKRCIYAPHHEAVPLADPRPLPKN